MFFFFFWVQSSSLYVGKGSINKVMEWYNLLVPKTRAYIQEAGFKPIIGVLLENSTSATLVLCLIERCGILPTPFISLSGR